MTVLIPATLDFSEGVPYAAAFGDVYHSADGGLEQARHVFMGGNGLPERWRNRERFSILETGFGLGLSFLTTWEAWRDDEARPACLHYTAIEKHPFRAPDLAQLHARWPQLAALSQELVAAWPPLVPGLHRIALAQGRVQLTLAFGDIAHCLPQIEAGAGFDAFYLDGFAPSKNPDMWAAPTLSRIGRLAASGATAATYTVAAAVRAALGQAGFVCEKRSGFGRKRDMLAAHYAPRWPLRAFAPPQRQAVVIGAGLAGCTAAQRLCARGWDVTLIERHNSTAQEISGNRAGIALPRLSQDDNVGSRIARAGFLFAQRIWREVGGIGQAFSGQDCGVLQLAADAREAQVQGNAARRFPDAPEFVRWLDADAVRAELGLASAHGGWLFPHGGWIHPASFCDALLAACGSRLTRVFAHEVAHLQRADSQWKACDHDRRVLAAAPHLILASGHGARAFVQAGGLPLHRVRGQVTHLPAEVLPRLPLVVCGEAYVTPAASGVASVGATYELDADAELRAESQRTNLERLQQMLPGLLPDDMHESVPLAGRVGFRCATPDRLPLAGTLPDPAAAVTGSRLREVPRLDGLHGLLGYGSRGLIWAPLCAELLAAQLEGEPLPLERDLAAALDPARFALKAHRRASTSSRKAD